jgi:hypothetical protein
MKKFLALAALAAASGAVAQGSPAPAFSPEAFHAHVAFLADDLLEGRQTGSRGHEIAAHYVAAQFAAAGLTPAGTDGSWFQTVPMREARIVEGSGRVTIGQTAFANGDRVMLTASVLEEKQDVSADVVFAGHCLYEPKLNIDDFRGLDLKGKIVACLHGFPAGLPSETAAYLVSSGDRFVAERGGIGRIQLYTQARERQVPFAKLVTTINNPRMQLLLPSGAVRDKSPGLKVTGSLSREASETLFAGAPRTFAQVDAASEEGSVRGFALKPRMRIERESTWKEITSPNVVGMVRGSDPALAAEIVVLGGHLDHLGVGQAINGDAIYNGALDNAAGSATLIEVAKATAAAPPKRSVLFVATTAEEKGLLGAAYYAENPTVPADKVVAMVDLDMPILTYDFQDVVAYGAQHSTVAEFVAAAAGEMGVTVSPDPIPQETIFVRSDHYEYVKQGVPAIMLSTGVLNGGDKAFADFLATQYHQPSDDLSLPIHWEAGARFAELNWRVMERIANAAEPPRWYRGDYFGDLFAPAAPKAAMPAVARAAGQ